jgi:hypothetical protein
VIGLSEFLSQHFIESRMYGLHLHVSFYLFCTALSKNQITITLSPGSAFECILNFANPRYQTGINRVAMNPMDG